LLERQPLSDEDKKFLGLIGENMIGKKKSGKKNSGRE
jgi:hypothetical protein